MNKIDILNRLSRSFHKVGFEIKKHSPEILVIGGVVGGIAGAVMACKATTKVSTIMEETKNNVDAVHYAVNHPEELAEEYTVEDSKKDLAIIYAQTGWKLVKLYAPSVIVGSLSVASILTSHGVMRKRNVALAAAYTAVDSSFKGYRKRVVERFGDELDKELRYNIKAKEIKETVVDEEGKKKTVKSTVYEMDTEKAEFSDFTRCYDNGCIGWDKDAELNRMFLNRQQAYANDILQKRGYLFLNEVFDMLGLAKTKIGHTFGWVYDPENPNHKGDNYVDFGIYDIKKEANRRFINGDEYSVWLDFNVDGPILDQIKKY